MRIVRFDAVVCTNVALGLVPEALYPVDVVLLVGEEFSMIDPAVMKVGNILWIGFIQILLSKSKTNNANL